MDLKKPSTFLGCDVSKDTVTFFETRLRQTTTVANRPAELKRFLARFEEAPFAVCEATGGYERALLKALMAANIPAHRGDAVKIKAFIRSFGTLGKTDTLDAKALADYGQERHSRLALWVMPDRNRVRLAALVQRRLDLVGMRSAEKNRAQAPGVEMIAASIRQLIAALDRQIKTIDARIQTLIDKDETIRRAVEVMSQMKGVGSVTAHSLCALMPELGSLTRRQAAALAGTAPHPNQSGRADNYRRVRGGRPQVRKTLFMAALVAARFEPNLKVFYQRLIEKGKKPIVAIAAVMRKIIVILNARLRDLYAKQMS